MRLAFAASIVSLLVGACENDKHHLHPEAGRDAPPPPWWRPDLGMAKDWDIQLAPPYDVSATRAMYDLDLWAVVPSAMSIDYGDGDPVAVPAGALAGKIAELKGKGVRVICFMDTGAVKTTDPDARKFPATSLGVEVDAAKPGEKYLDIRASTRTAWTPIMFKRFDFAKQIGCDGVDGGHNDSIMPVMSGFPVMPPDSYSWYGDIAAQLHQRELSAGMRNGHTLPGQVDMLADDYDWMVIERCGEIGDCDQVRPFLNLRREVFAIEYASNFDGDPNNADSVCNQETRYSVTAGIVKDDAISSAMRHPCSP